MTNIGIPETFRYQKYSYMVPAYSNISRIFRYCPVIFKYLKIILFV